MTKPKLPEKLKVHAFEDDGTVGNCAICGRGPSRGEHDPEGWKTAINEIIDYLSSREEGEWVERPDLNEQWKFNKDKTISIRPQPTTSKEVCEGNQFPSQNPLQSEDVGESDPKPDKSNEDVGPPQPVKEWDRIKDEYSDSGLFDKASYSEDDLDRDVKQMLDQARANRDREILEKIEEIKKMSVVIKVEDPYGNWHNTPSTLENYLQEVGQSFSDLSSFIKETRGKV